MKIVLQIIMFILTCSLFSHPAFALDYTILDHAVFLRSKGKPLEQVIELKSPFEDPNARIFVLNGGANEKNRVSSALVKLNGQQVFKPNNFNNNVSNIEEDVSIKLGNVLSVTVNGNPGDYLTIVILGSPPPPTIQITNPIEQETINAPSVLVRGKVETFAEHFSVFVNGEKAMVSGRDFFINSLPLNQGANLIRAEVREEVAPVVWTG